MLHSKRSSSFLKRYQLTSMLLIFVYFPSYLSIMAPGLDEKYNEFQLQLMLLEESYSGNRSYIGNVTYDRSRILKFSRSIPCVKGLLDEYYRYPYLTAFLAPHVYEDNTGLTETFINRLNMDMASILTGELDASVKDDVTANALILIDKASDLQNVTCCMIHTCGRDCHFAVVLTSDFENEKDFLEESNQVKDILWTHAIGKVVILGIVNENVLMAGSIAYKVNDVCAPAETVLLRQCDDKLRIHNIEDFQDFLIPLLDDCIVKISFFSNFPYSYESNDTCEMDGVEGLMVKDIMKSLKATVYTENIRWTNESNVHEEMKWRLTYEAGYDLVFGGLLWSPDADIDYSISYDKVQIVWMIPVTPNLSLRGLVTPFTGYVWLAIGFVLLIGGLVKIFFIQEISFLDILGLVIGVAVARQPKKSSSRIQFMSWVIFGFFLTQSYLCQLADQLMSGANLQMETMKELVESDMKYGGPARFVSLFDELDEDDDGEGNAVIETIRENYIVFENADYIRRLADLQEGRNDSLALIVMLNVSTDTQGDSNDNFRILKESLGSYPLALATWAGLPYLADIDFRIQCLVQAGLVQYYTEKVMYQDMHDRFEREEFATNNLEIKQLAPGFLLFIMGYIAGFLMLIVEIAAYPSKFLL